MATILRQDSPALSSASEAARPAVYTFSNMATQGDEYVQAVRAEAAKIIQQANAEAAAIRQKAETEGRQAAETAIEQLLAERLGKQMQTLKPALDKAVQGIVDGHGEWLDHWEKTALSLAAAMAQRIVRRELSQDPSIAKEWIRESLELTASSSEVTIRLNPEDHAKLKDEVATLAESIHKAATPHIIADASITPGGCRVETKHGSVDQQIETQLARLSEELF